MGVNERTHLTGAGGAPSSPLQVQGVDMSRVTKATVDESVVNIAKVCIGTGMLALPFAVLGLTSMGSTFCSVRSLRYVIFPIQILAKSCKPIPVMLMGAVLGKKYPRKKYVNVMLIVGGVGLFMGGGDNKKRDLNGDETSGGMSQVIGLVLLFFSLCFDGGTGAYEDKLMSKNHVGPFDLMYNIQLGKTILAGLFLIIFNQVRGEGRDGCCGGLEGCRGSRRREVWLGERCRRFRDSTFNYM